MPRKAIKKVKATSKTSVLSRIEKEVESNQSRMSLILGGLIILVVGVLIFNYFNKNKAEVGPAQQAETTESSADVNPENLPGKYTVKEGDTLFTIAEKYYKDGFYYTEIATANNLVNVDSITEGQVLEIPKVEIIASPSPEATASPEPSPTAEASVEPTAEPSVEPSMQPQADTIAPTETAQYGPVITGNTYTVVEGDWLSTIAARAYGGDIQAYTKIAEANNITNPDYILPGMVLTIPR